MFLTPSFSWFIPFIIVSSSFSSLDSTFLHVCNLFISPLHTALLNSCVSLYPEASDVSRNITGEMQLAVSDGEKLNADGKNLSLDWGVFAHRDSFVDRPLVWPSLTRLDFILHLNVNQHDRSLLFFAKSLKSQNMHSNLLLCFVIRHSGNDIAFTNMYVI